MGIFGQPTDLDSSWDDTFDHLREQYADCVAIALDIHI